MWGRKAGLAAPRGGAAAAAGPEGATWAGSEGRAGPLLSSPEPGRPPAAPDPRGGGRSGADAAGPVPQSAAAPRHWPRGDAGRGAAGGARPIRAGGGGGRPSAASPGPNARVPPPPAARTEHEGDRAHPGRPVRQPDRGQGEEARRSPYPKPPPRAPGPETGARPASPPRAGPRVALAPARPRTKGRARPRGGSLPGRLHPACPPPLPGHLWPAEHSASQRPSAPRRGRSRGDCLGVALCCGVPTQPGARRMGRAGLGGGSLSKPSNSACRAPNAPQQQDVLPEARPPPCPQPPSYSPQLPDPTLFLCWGKGWAQTRGDLGPGRGSPSAHPDLVRAPGGAGQRPPRNRKVWG